MRSITRSTLAVFALLAAGAHAQAATLNGPISFSQAGTVTLTLDYSHGGYDHILEMANGTGPLGTPLLALTDLAGGSPSTDVLGYTPANLGDSVNLGSFSASQELIFRLTNIGSNRKGTPGEILDQTFTGTSSGNNPNPTDYYTLVDSIDPTTIKVYWEDLFSVPVTDPDPANTLLSGYDAGFTLTLTPVPVPAAAWLFGSGLLGLIGVGRRKAA